MQKELATMSFSFGPNNNYTLHMPMTRDDLAKSLQHFARVLLAANSELPPEEQQSAQPPSEQLTFNWGEPICGSHEKIPV